MRAVVSRGVVDACMVSSWMVKEDRSVSWALPCSGLKGDMAYESMLEVSLIDTFTRRVCRIVDA